MSNKNDQQLRIKPVFTDLTNIPESEHIARLEELAAEGTATNDDMIRLCLLRITAEEEAMLTRFRETVANRPKRNVVKTDLTNIPKHKQIEHLKNLVAKGTATHDDKIELIVLESVAEQGYYAFCEIMREKMVKAYIIPYNFLLEDFTLEEFGVGIELLTEKTAPQKIAYSKILAHRPEEKECAALTFVKTLKLKK